jgi:hypothetical protein
MALDGTNVSTSLDICFKTVKEWFALNGLSLNPDKSEAIVIGTSARQRTDGSINVVALGTDSIAVSESVRSLGVTIDSTLSFNTHVNNVCKSVRYHTRALRHVRKCVSIDDAKQIAAAMVSARLDYCNSILYKTSMSNISKLQRLQNSLARVVSGARKRDHITPI